MINVRSIHYTINPTGMIEFNINNLLTKYIVKCLEHYSTMLARFLKRAFTNNEMLIFSCDNVESLKSFNKLNNVSHA